jgi:hypothetical protein
MMLGIGLTVAEKFELVHLDPAAQQLIKIPSGVIYYPLWEHRISAQRLQIQALRPMTVQIGIELLVHFKPTTLVLLQVPMGLTMYNFRLDALTNLVTVEVQQLN